LLSLGLIECCGSLDPLDVDCRKLASILDAVMSGL